MSYSVIMHVYNEEDYLESVLASIENQSVQKDQLFVVDNGSIDGTNDILHKLKVNHEHYISGREDPPYKRRAECFNKCLYLINAPGSKFLLKVDGDTLLSNNYAEKLLPYMKDPNVAAVSGLSTYYRKTRELNNGAVLYRRKTLPYAEPINGWDRQIQMTLIRRGYHTPVCERTTYTDLKLPTSLRPPIVKVINNRLEKKLFEYEGIFRRKLREYIES